MRGIRAIGFGSLVVGIIAILGGSGCCCLQKDDSNERMKQLLHESGPSPDGDDGTTGGQKESHLTPERVHGGII
jgi:hypothetical protein